MPSSPRSPMRRTVAHGGEFSPAGPSSSTAFSEGGGEGSASKNGRRSSLSLSSASAAAATSSASGATESAPALISRGLLGFTLGCLGVLTFMWLSSLATTADGVPSTLLLARQRSDRELSRVRVREGTSSEDPGWGDGCSDPSKWILWGRDWSDLEGGGPPGGVCKPQPSAGSSSTSSPSPKKKGVGDCASTIGMPKVALMFLTAGTLPHAEAWEAWLDLAAGLLPTDCVASAACHETRSGARAAATTLGAGGGGKGSAGASALASLVEKNCPREKQHLFSLYVHTPKGVDFLEGVSPASRFSKALIKNRVATEWGGFTLASATRALLRAALLDANNQRFALLSESCVPLYAPAVVYSQLIYSEKSRINACADGVKADWPLDGYRYSWRMKDATDGKLTEGSWRKSHQWVGLTRKHAAATAADTVVAEAFKKHCTNAPDPDLGGAWRSCFSDEHYFPTLLAIGGWDSETDCEGDMTHTVWCRGWHCVGDLKLHPRTYHPSDLSSSAASKSDRRDGSRGDGAAADENKPSPKTKDRKTSPPSSPALDAAEFLRSLRRAPPVSLDAEPGPRCEDDAAARAAGGLLSPVAALVARARGGRVAAVPAAAGHRPSDRRRAPSREDPAALVGGRCSLFARKFKDDVRWRVRRGLVALAAEDEREAFPSSS